MDPAGDDQGQVPTCHDPRIDITAIEMSSDGASFTYYVEVLNKSRLSATCAGMPTHVAHDGRALIQVFTPAHTHIMTYMNPVAGPGERTAFLRFRVYDGEMCAYHLYKDEQDLLVQSPCNGETFATERGYGVTYPLVHSGGMPRDNWDFRGQTLSFETVRAQSGYNVPHSADYRDDVRLPDFVL